jgi:hypothetical protein
MPVWWGWAHLRRPAGCCVTCGRAFTRRWRGVGRYRIEIPVDTESDEALGEVQTTAFAAVAAGARDNRVVVQSNWTRQKGEPCVVPKRVQLTVPLAGGAFSLAFSPDGHYLAAGAGSGDTVDAPNQQDAHPITLFHVHDAWTTEVDAETDVRWCTSDHVNAPLPSVRRPTQHVSRSPWLCCDPA